MYICTSSSFACPRHSGARATPGAVGGGNFLLILPGSIFVGSGADDDRDGIEDAFAFLVVELVRDGGRERERERGNFPFLLLKKGVARAPPTKFPCNELHQRCLKRKG